MALILRDNTPHTSTADNISQFLALQPLANKTLSELQCEYGNSLLIYPQSFAQNDDISDEQMLFSMQTRTSDSQVTQVKVRTGNICGFIGVNGESVSIQSRFESDGNDIFLHYMLAKVLDINIVNLMHGTSKDMMFDFLLYLFPRLLNDAMRQGLYKEYRSNENNDAKVRGVIDINSHLRKNLPFAGRVAYHAREFCYDNHITQLIRHTVEYIGQSKLGSSLLAVNDETRCNVARIVAATPSYARFRRDAVIKSNIKVCNHPYYSLYAPLQRLCMRILRHEKIKYGAVDDHSIYGVLFDIASLWEEYLAKIFVGLDFVHPNNRKKLGVVHLAKNALPRYPDFYSKDERIVVDAKYKREVTRDDEHQVIAYMYRFKAHEGVLLQPSKTPCQGKSNELQGYGFYLKTYYFAVPQTTDLKQFVAEMKQSEEQLKTYFKRPQS